MYAIEIIATLVLINMFAPSIGIGLGKLCDCIDAILVFLSSTPKE